MQWCKQYEIKKRLQSHLRHQKESAQTVIIINAHNEMQKVNTVVRTVVVDLWCVVWQMTCYVAWAILPTLRSESLE